ncbi:MAG: 3-keto-5-aminohexanoate cleavage protein [Solirubrobacterales bacterium]
MRRAALESVGHANWAVVDAGLVAGVDVRVGLEDALVGRDGEPAPGNAAQVEAILGSSAPQACRLPSVARRRPW